jgi:arsenite methyltransferase
MEMDDRKDRIGQFEEKDGIKACCALLYESDWARLLLGEAFHPGGLALTQRLGSLLDLKSSSYVLDVASGNGASAIYLAQRFGCRVVGIEYSRKNVVAASSAAERAGMAGRVCFKLGDAESLPFRDEEFDALICECAFCTFPDKETAAGEFERVLQAGGRLGISDVTRTGILPEELNGLLAWIACLGDAQPVEQYAQYLRKAGLVVGGIENHDEALSELVKGVRAKLLGVELLVRLEKLALPGADFEVARQFARAASEAVENGRLGYSLILGQKPSGATKRGSSLN